MKYSWTGNLYELSVPRYPLAVVCVFQEYFFDVLCWHSADCS